MKRQNVTSVRPALRCLSALVMLLGAGAAHADRCSVLIQAFGSQLADVSCVDSTDLTTANPATTPANNSLPGLPPFAFTPQTDRATIAPDAANRTPIAGPVPGVQLNARIASDPTGQARFLLRLPAKWNGRLVVAGASGTRSEFNGDFAWSDYVVQKGYAYASQNKGVLNLKFSDASDPLACRLNPTSPLWVQFYDNGPGQEFTRWRDYMVLASKLAHKGAAANYGKSPRYTYAVGTSNGAYQVRRAVESAPDWFDGGVDWEGTFVDENGPNLLTDLPVAVRNYPDYVASGADAASTAAKNIRGAGFPPDLGSGATSLWAMNSASFWEVTLCQWQKRVDPAYDTYGSGPGDYNYIGRLPVSKADDAVADFATTGRIKRPLITVAGTMDALLPIDHHARAYARKVAASTTERGDDDDRHRHGHRRDPAYRLYEVQNGNHIETYKLTLPQLELIQPHAQRAFDLLVSHVEQGKALPPDQCIGRGAAIADAPAQPGHCAELLAP
ncbi:MAG: hypothetical protein H6R14_2471 [Proteobacteria bacterium]|nr:hypothetical protein [Pseudomonadota bacterium]